MKLNISLYAKRSLAFLHDVIMVPVAWAVAYLLRYNLQDTPIQLWHDVSGSLPVVVAVQALVCWYLGLYRGVWRFASVRDVVKIVQAAFFGVVISSVMLFLMSRSASVPRSVIPLYFILYTLFIGGSRFLYRWLRDHSGFFTKKKRVLIIGAGQAGEGLVRDLLRGAASEYKPVVLIDDAKQKRGREVHGVRVAGGIDDLPRVAAKYHIDLVMMAIPSIRSARLRHVVGMCETLDIPLRTLPSVNDLTSGRVTMDALRAVQIEDLLGRDPVQLDWQVLSKIAQDQIVLVTGGGGSLGSELCRQIARCEPKRLIIFDHSEFNLYSISMELRKKFPALELVRLLVDVTDEKLTRQLFAEYRPDLVFHAAAYKHVPLLESQAIVAVKNNVLGTRNLADLADRYHVKKFIMVSTDKAVNPTNVMGATKRVAEIYCQNKNARSKTEFITVRFGNVLGSAGSVVPLFRKQIEHGGPVTVTHEKMTRYFMTIKEAVSLILQSASIGKGGEIFVLDMGEPVSIRYLAEKMIQLSGLKVGEDINITYTGLRPGEKLYEELFHEGETLIATQHEKISMAESRQLIWNDVCQAFNEVAKAYDKYNEEELLAVLLALVPEYHSEKTIKVASEV